MFVVAWREWFRDYRRCLVVCAVLASAIDTEAEAQMATLEGTVQDGSGGVIASAAVSLREQDTNQSRTALTDGQGIFRFAGVPPGAYEVRVTYDGFEPYAHAGLTPRHRSDGPTERGVASGRRHRKHCGKGSAAAARSAADIGGDDDRHRAYRRTPRS